MNTPITIPAPAAQGGSVIAHCAPLLLIIPVLGWAVCLGMCLRKTEFGVTARKATLHAIACSTSASIFLSICGAVGGLAGLLGLLLAANAFAALIAGWVWVVVRVTMGKSARYPHEVFWAMIQRRRVKAAIA